MDRNNKTKEESRSKAQRQYAGASTDRADDNHVTANEVEQETRMLNNNPRNSGR